MSFSPSRTRTLNHSTTNTSSNGSSFLSFNRPPRVFIASGSSHPPERALLGLQEEGFSVTPLPFSPSNPQLFISTVKNLHNELNVGESFALIAYSAAATVALQVAQKPVAKLCALIAYYPTVIPSPSLRFPSLLKVMVHIAGLNQISAPPDVCQWKCYRYEMVRTGFAEEGSRDFEAVEASLAWTRTLTVLRAAFIQQVELEEVVDKFWKGKPGMISLCC